MTHGAGGWTKDLEVNEESMLVLEWLEIDSDGTLNTHRIAFVFDLAGVWLNLGVIPCDELIQVLVDADGCNGISHASGLVGADGSCVPKGTDDKTIA